MEKPYQVLYDYSDVPTLKRFTLDNSRVRCVMGPFGCLRGDVKIVTERGVVPIAGITQPVRVLSWNEKYRRFVLSSASIPIRKGTDYLYRIVTQQGEFVAAGHHRVFVGGHRYQQVKNLREGDILPVCAVSRFLKSTWDDSIVYNEDVRYFLERDEDYLDDYAGLIRQYDPLFPVAVNTAATSSPLPIYVQTSICLDGRFFSAHMDGRLEPLLEHNHRHQYAFPKQIDDFPLQVERHNEVSQGYIFSQLFLRSAESIRRLLISLPKNASRYIKKLFSEYFHSYKSSSLSDRAIIKIERLNVKEDFWDMHVFETNNYVTADGTIHHNSGKSSACVMEIIRRASLQEPGPDGIRRSRWAVVRNSYGQLKDTTIRTFHDWFPPKLFGEYRVTDHMFIITRLPGIHLEILFRALDRPDQVSNLLSLEVTSAWFNESREIPRTIIEAMDARIGRFPSKRDGGPTWYGMIMDTNPPDEDSYLYKMFEKVKPDGWKMFKQPSGLSARAENTKHLPKGYYSNLAKGKDEMYKRIYIHGQYGFLVTGKPVFQSFVDNVHVAPNIIEPIKGLDVILGFDFGLQPACAIGQIDPMGKLVILDELVSDGMGLRQFCESQLIPLLRRKYFGMSVMGYGDPSGASRAPTDESTCFEVLHSREVGLSGVIPAPTNAIMPRVSAVETFLNKMWQGEPAFLLSPNCHFLRKALNGAYHYEKEPKSQGEEYKAMPVKNFYSHVSDALQMLCMYLSEKESQDRRWKSFQATMKRREYRPASYEAGY